MRLNLLLGGFLLVFVTIGLLPSVEAQVGRKHYLPMVSRDSTPTRVPPTNTPVPQDVRIEYRGFSQDRGWLPWQSEGNIAGTTGEGRRLEAIEMRIISGPPGVNIRYRAHVQDIGWMDWQTNGGTAGTTNQSRTIEAVQLALDNAPPTQLLSFDTHVDGWGWLGWIRGGWIGGTTGQGRRMEAFRAYVRRNLGEEPADIQIAYNSNPRSVGYQGWRRNGEDSGTRGESRPLNTFKAVLMNRPENMKIEYRCFVQDNDWQGWTDGECGIFHADKDIYAFEMRLINPYTGVVLSYTGHVANRGDVSYASDSPGSNPIIGNPSDRFRIEQIKIGVGESVRAR